MSALEPRQRPAPLADLSIEIVDPCDTLSAFVAVCPDLSAAEASIYALLDVGLDPGKGSIVWRGGLSHFDVPSLDRLAQRSMFWRTCGHLWNGLADLPAVGLMTTIPEIGVILVGGRLATVLVTSAQYADVEDVDTGGLGTLGAALVRLGLPRHDLPLCLEALKVGDCLSVGHGSSDDVEHAVGLLRSPVCQRDLVPCAAESLAFEHA